jgi:hypothetical protein
LLFVIAGAVRPGDWLCHSCDNNNYARRTQCNKCGEVRADDDARSAEDRALWGEYEY